MFYVELEDWRSTAVRYRSIIYASGYGLGGSEYISISEIVWKFDFQRSTSDNRFLEIAYLSII